MRLTWLSWSCVNLGLKDIHQEVHWNLQCDSMMASPFLGFINYRAICEHEEFFPIIKAVQFSKQNHIQMYG